jgi:hypothetical protein
MIAGVIVGFIAMLFLSFIPILGPILGGLVAGLICGGGAARGLVAGFLAGILGAVIMAILVTTGFSFFGGIAGFPLVGAIFGGSIGFVIVIAGLYEGFLGLIGGAIGGAIRRRR